jgi:hypothetical protein
MLVVLQVFDDIVCLTNEIRHQLAFRLGKTFSGTQPEIRTAKNVGWIEVRQDRRCEMDDFRTKLTAFFASFRRQHCHPRFAFDVRPYALGIGAAIRLVCLSPAPFHVPPLAIDTESDVDRIPVDYGCCWNAPVFSHFNAASSTRPVAKPTKADPAARSFDIGTCTNYHSIQSLQRLSVDNSVTLLVDVDGFGKHAHLIIFLFVNDNGVQFFKKERGWTMQEQ